MRAINCIFLILVSIQGCGHDKQTRNVPVTIGSSKSVETDGSHRPCIVTENNLKVWCNGANITAGDMETAVAIFSAFVIELFDIGREFTVSAISRAPIVWAIDTRSLSAMKKHGFSETSTGKEIYMLWPGSISESDLFHEWLHEVLPIATLSRDPDHKGPWWKELRGLILRAKRAGI